MTLSIITINLNNADGLERTLASVARQQPAEISVEHVIIDGASTDSSVERIRAYAAASHPYKVVWVSEPDKGIYNAMNKGIRMARGTLVGIVNSDDFYQSDALERVKAHYDPSLRYQILYGAQNNIDDDGDITTFEFVHHKNLPVRMINHPASFVANAVYQDKALYSLEYRTVSDYDFMLKMFYDPDVTFLPIHEVLTNFYVGGVSSSTKSHLETFKLWRRYGCITNKRYWLITLSTYVKELIH